MRTLVVDSTSLINGKTLVGDVGHGIYGYLVPENGTDGPSPVRNDLTFPADNYVEVRWQILTRPSSGTFFSYEDCSFEFTAPSDGEYTFTYRLFKDGVPVGDYTVIIQIGVDNSAAPIPGVQYVKVTEGRVTEQSVLVYPVRVRGRVWYPTR